MYDAESGNRTRVTAVRGERSRRYATHMCFTLKIGVYSKHLTYILASLHDSFFMNSFTCVCYSHTASHNSIKVAVHLVWCIKSCAWFKLMMSLSHTRGNGCISNSCKYTINTPT
jgi:hypothetical protein